MKNVFIIAAALVLGACRPSPVRPPDVRPLPEPEAVLEALRAQAGNRTSLRTLGRVTYFGTEGRVRLKAVLLARRPGAFRVETLSPFEQPIDVMASDGDDLWLLREDQLRFGAASPRNISRLLPLAMSAEALVDTLMGGVPDARDTQALGITRGEDGRLLVRVRSKEGAVGRLTIDPVAKRVETMELLGEDRAPIVTVRFSDFEAVASGGELPRDIDIELAGQDSEVSIKLGSPELNAPLADELFRIDAPAGVAVLPLDVD